MAQVVQVAKPATVVAFTPAELDLIQAHANTQIAAAQYLLAEIARQIAAPPPSA